jgi:WD40 repeat protein
VKPISRRTAFFGVASGLGLGAVALGVWASKAPSMLEQKQAGPGLSEFKRLEVKGYLNAVAWNNDNSRLAALSDFGRTITVWETRNWSLINEFDRYGGGYSSNSLAYTADGMLLTSAPVGKSPDPKYQTLAIFSLILWDPEAGRAIRYIPDPVPDTRFRIEDADTYAVSRDGKLVAGITTGSRDGPVLLFETATWTLVGHFFVPPTPKHPDGAWCLAFSPDSREIAVGTLFGYVHLVAIGQETPRLSFSAYLDGVPCFAVAYSHNGQVLATGRGQAPLGAADDGRTRLWAASDGGSIAILKGGGAGVHKLSWSDTGLLAIAHDQSLAVWDAAEPIKPRMILHSDGATYSVAFDKTGTLAATRGNEVKLYKPT